jgi:lipid II:glycine glycyltransferase (peptidoglycan interpeptide bridge formation enzyme)
MLNREDYVAKLKTQLDRWNADMARWEGEARNAQAEMKKRYEKDLENLRAQREKAMYQLKLLEGASATAWQEISRGVDDAWDRMRASFDQARAQFEKKPKP